ncbi:MAG: Holliday junction branch migration protein RuvA [Alphaproteobacteria bacterium]|jgi:Holliday junction DNA helicase RuvA|nr:Holliday junction branch migration protein RuvA [Alphaproteobacteria bacterium]
MIAKLSGIVDTSEEEGIILNVNGVGYLVYTPCRFSDGEQCSVHIQTIVREDAINLYGFKTIQEKKLFNLLISVQGIGAKVAMQMMSQLSASEIAKAILFEDVKTLKSVNGVGEKVAQRLLVELKTKITKIETIPNFGEAKKAAIIQENSNTEDAITALLGLGYSKIEIMKTIQIIQESKGADLASEELIKEFLVYMAQGLGK